MKKPYFPIVLTFILLGSNANATQITEHMTGSWYNPDQDGHGFNIEVYRENRSVFYWYVYNPDGTPTWLVGRGAHADGRIEGVAYYNSGMRWGVFDPNERTQVRWGVVNIDFLDCNSATVSYQSDDLSEQAIPHGSGSFNIVRLTSVHKSKCNEKLSAGIYRGGFWSEAAESGFSGIALLANDNFFVAYAMGHKTFFGEYLDGEFLGPGGGFQALGGAYDNASGDLHNVIFEANGEISRDYRFNADYSVGGWDSGNMDFYPVTQLYNRGITLAGLAGDYVFENIGTFAEGTASIAADGSVSGAQGACAWNGQVTIPDTAFNEFGISLTLSGCGELVDGFYEGMGFQDDAQNLGDGLGVWFFTRSEQKSFLGGLSRLTP